MSFKDLTFYFDEEQFMNHILLLFRVFFSVLWNPCLNQGRRNFPHMFSSRSFVILALHLCLRSILIWFLYVVWDINWGFVLYCLYIWKPECSTIFCWTTVFLDGITPALLSKLIDNVWDCFLIFLFVPLIYMSNLVTKNLFGLL